MAFPTVTSCQLQRYLGGHAGCCPPVRVLPDQIDLGSGLGSGIAIVVSVMVMVVVMNRPPNRIRAADGCGSEATRPCGGRYRLRETFCLFCLRQSMSRDTALDSDVGSQLGLRSALALGLALGSG